MTKINDGGHAFPTTYSQFPGMSLRDYVAIHAPISLDDAIDLCGFNRSHHPMRNDTDRTIILEVLVRARLQYAEAMLAARSGGQDDA